MNFWENADGSGAQRDGASPSNARSGYRDAGAGNAQNAHMGQGFVPNSEFADRLAGFSGKSEDQLMSELVNAVNRMKADGTFDVSSLERLYATAAPFMSEGQRSRMRGIIDMLTR